jgi:phosphoesterase RecJ-like protein
MEDTTANMMIINLAQTAEVLRRSQRILLLTHLQPDGDAVGSLLATNALLAALGKEVTAVCHDAVPKNLRVLPGWEQIKKPAEVTVRDFDLACSLDASDLTRLGDGGQLFSACPRTLVIDHHASNLCFGMENYIDSQVAATGNLVFRLYEELEVPLNEDIAALLYAAISTDTGNFSFGQMDEEFFLQMSKLMRAGLDISRYSRALHLVKDLSFYRLLGRCLGSLNFECGGRLSMMRLSENDFLQTNTTQDLTEGLVNYALNIPGVQMCFLATQVDAAQTKFSLRALAPHNVAVIAAEMGGGGHVLAAGFTLNLPLGEAVNKVKARMMNALCP